MKTYFYLFFLFSSFSYAQLIPELSVCHSQISEISISGSVSFVDGHWDASEACVQVTMTYDLCDQNGNTFASGFTSTSSSSACGQKSLPLGSRSMAVPVGLLGDIKIDEQPEIPMIYPNPSSGDFTLTGKKDLNINDIQIFDMNGEKVNGNLYKTEEGFQINLNENKPGTYIVKFNKDGLSFTQQIVKK